VIRPEFVYASDFTEGLAVVRSDYKHGPFFIDSSGKVALKMNWWNRWPFFDGLTIAGENGKQVYVNRSGGLVAPYEVNPGYSPPR
jgi:hypothetical protein